MKASLLLIVFFATSTHVIGQTPKSDGPLPGPSPSVPGIIDGVVMKEQLISQTKMEYPNVREADYVWSKRVFSRIDAREKMNHSIFYPYDYFLNSLGANWTPPSNINEISKKDWQRHDERWSLWTIIVQHIMMGDLTVFLTEPDKSNFESGNKLLEDGYSFKYPIISTIKDPYFKDNKYRKEINKVLSSGASRGPAYAKVTIPNSNGDEFSLVKGPDNSETFDEWYIRLTTEGRPDLNQGPEVYTDLISYRNDDSVNLKLAFDFTSVNQALTSPPEPKFISSASIVAYNIKEDWYFDKNRSKLERRIIAIAPVGRFNGDTTENGFINRSNSFIFKNNEGKLVDANNEVISSDSVKVVEKELFWLYFPALRDVIVNYYVYNDKNDAQWDSFDDLFIQRRFSSVPYKTSDKFDRDIEEYKFGTDRLYEAERIKEDIRNWEQNIWNY